jgi:pimeloyl-ACP methyl ester carboxylesterase
MQACPGLESYARTIELPGQGLKLFAYVAGQPAPLTFVLLHGLGDEADSWRHLIEPLAAYGQVVAPDLPGFGRSAKPRRKYNLPFLQAVVAELVEQLGITSAILVGSSLGAVVAQSLALERPAWLKGLVLIDGALLSRSQRIDPGLLLFILPGLGEWLYTRLRKDPQAAYDTLQPYYADLDGLPQAEQEFLYQRVNQRVWDDAQRSAYFSTLRNLAPYVARQQKGLPGRLARLEVPTLILWGAEDRIMPPSNGQAAADAQPSARFVSLPGCGHLPQQEVPQAVLQAILEDGRFNLHR